MLPPRQRRGDRKVVQRNGVGQCNLAYINHSICQVDNGRVLGFDNAHDYHHWHYMGVVAAFEFTSYEATLEKFQQEWLEIVKGKRGKRS